jgi:phage terminase large subunit GpA-like protein
MFVVDTYTAKDRIFDRLKRAPGEPGSIHFPAAHLEGAMPLDATFFKRLTKERPKVIPGQDGTSWANQPKDQEPWDTLVGCYTLLHAVYAKPGGAKLRIRLNADKAEQVPQVEDTEAVNVDSAPTPHPGRQACPRRRGYAAARHPAVEDDRRAACGCPGGQGPRRGGQAKACGQARRIPDGAVEFREPVTQHRPGRG